MIKNLGLSILSGLLLAVAWPTYGFSILIFVAFIPLLIMEHSVRKNDKHTKRKVFVFSYISFFIWNIITTWWIWYSTELGMIFAILVNSLLMTIVFMVYHFVAKRLSEKMALIFLVAVWISFEKFHLTWEVSWPWLNLGNVFSEQITWVQWYAYTGSFGGTLWVWLVNIILFLGVKEYAVHKNRKQLAKNTAFAVLVFTLPTLLSFFMYVNHQEKGEAISVVVLQPNIDPYEEKYQLSNEKIAEKLIVLTEQQIDDNVRFVITPETVFADNIRLNALQESYPLLMLKRLTVTYPKLNMVSGVAMIETFSDESRKTSQSNYWKSGIWYNDYNSAFLLNKSSDLELYHKSKLVVGVENFPYQNVLKPIFGETLIDLGGTVALKTTQENRSVFVGIDGIGKAAPIICYESIYGEFVTGYVRNGANFLAILTNDAWWRDTQGHKQLLSYARLRAVETRRSVARSANTGISAFINQRGDVLKTLAYNTQGSLKADIQLNEELTFYVKYGDYIARISYFLTLFIFLFSLARKKELIFMLLFFVLFVFPFGFDETIAEIIIK